MADDLFSSGRERANHKSMALGNSSKEDIVEKMKNEIANLKASLSLKDQEIELRHAEVKIAVDDMLEAKSML